MELRKANRATLKKNVNVLAFEPTAAVKVGIFTDRTPIGYYAEVKGIVE